MDKREITNLQEETLISIKEYLPKLISGVKSCSDKFQGGDDHEGAKLSIQVMDGLKWVMDSLILTKDIQKESIDVGEINDMLNELLDAYENQDYILCGDLYFYEILPILENWNDMING